MQSEAKLIPGAVQNDFRKKNTNTIFGHPLDRPVSSKKLYAIYVAKNIGRLTEREANPRGPFRYKRAGNLADGTVLLACGRERRNTAVNHGVARDLRAALRPCLCVCSSGRAGGR